MRPLSLLIVRDRQKPHTPSMVVCRNYPVYPDKRGMAPVFATTPEIPSHIPAELIRRFDINNDPEVLADPWAAIDRLREDSPLLWSPELGGYWIATTADL